MKFPSPTKRRRNEAGKGEGPAGAGSGATVSLQSCPSGEEDGGGGGECDSSSRHCCPRRRAASDGSLLQNGRRPLPPSKASSFPPRGRSLRKLLRPRRPGADDDDDAASSVAAESLAERFAPPPLGEDDVVRLRELKEAKRRAELRRRRASGGDDGGAGGGGGGGDDSGTSAPPSPVGSVDSRGSATFAATAPEEGRATNRDAATFLGALLLRPLIHALPLPAPVEPLVRVALQCAALRSFLAFLLIGAFEHVELGRSNLVKNMEHGKRLYEAEVRKWTAIVSAATGGISCAAALGGSALRILAGTACDRGLREGDDGTFCACLLRGPSDEPWGARALGATTFLTTRAGAFVLVLLLLARATLPKKSGSGRRR